MLLNTAQRRFVLAAIVIAALGAHLWYCRWRRDELRSSNEMFVVRWTNEFLHSDGSPPFRADHSFGIWHADGVDHDEALLGGVFVPIAMLGLVAFLLLGWRHRPTTSPRA